MLVSACSSRTAIEADEDETTSESGETGDGEETSATDTASETTGSADESCSCIESRELVCDDQTRPMALHDCEVPNPCGTIDLDDPSADVATCILQLLVDQEQPSRFDYVAHVSGDWGDDTYVGTFFILGTGEGVDLECVYPSYDCCAPPPPVVTPTFHGLQEPAYFQDCIGKATSVMAGCIFNGVEQMDVVAECAGP